jgi:peptidoglycan-associated lipoprotein
MKRIFPALGLMLASPSIAQLVPVPAPVAPPTEAYFVDIPALQVDLVMKAGSDRVYFAGSDYGLNTAARATLAAQARWLLANPTVRAVIEGHSDQRDTRDHALAIGERRATAVRDYLVSLGIPSVRLVVVSWGKERPIQPGPGDVGFDRNARVVTTIVR